MSYVWTLVSKPSVSSATLTNPRTVTPSFIADVDGTYVLQLIVNDGLVSLAADTVTAVANTINSAPVAQAGNDQNVQTLSTVNLSGHIKHVNSYNLMKKPGVINEKNSFDYNRT